MNRLTQDGDYCQGCTNDCMPNLYPERECIWRKRYNKLRAYELTGLEPEEVAYFLGATMTVKDAKAQYAEHKKRYDEWFEWKQAESEGRLLVLPETVYQHDAERIYESKVRRVIYETDAGFAFDERAIGQTVFLTREEAEAALKEGTT